MNRLAARILNKSHKRDTVRLLHLEFSVNFIACCCVA